MTGVLRWLRSWRSRDPIIDTLIRPPVDLGFGKHNEAQAVKAKQRRHMADVLTADAVRARLPRRLVILEEARGQVRGFTRG